MALFVSQYMIAFYFYPGLIFIKATADGIIETCTSITELEIYVATGERSIIGFIIGLALEIIPGQFAGTAPFNQMRLIGLDKGQ